MSLAESSSPSPEASSGPRVHSFTFPTMGTLGRVSWSGGVDEAELFSVLVARVREIEARLTRFSRDSEISRLDGTWREVSEDIAAVMAAARVHHAGTRGHFSALMGAQMRAWTEIAGAASSDSAGVESERPSNAVGAQEPAQQQARIRPGVQEQTQLQTPARLQAQAQVGGERALPGSEGSLPSGDGSLRRACGSIEVDGGRCRVIGAPPRAVDLGGIAKGYAADQLRDLAVALGAGDVLVSLGTSSMAVADSPARIGLASPWVGWERAGILTLGEGALAVSADPGTVRAGRHSELVRQRSHVLDPATGEPALTDLCCVVVCGADGMACEAYSTAYLAMGLDAALELDSEHPELSTMFLTVSGRMLASPSLRFAAARGIQEWLAH
ncbi:MAG: FAD:protein FMN transferase [Ancrocorticia sp.]